MEYDVIDYSIYFQEIISVLNDSNELLQAILSIIIIVIIIILCHYTYKFFNMFF